MWYKVGIPIPVERRAGRILRDFTQALKKRDLVIHQPVVLEPRLVPRVWGGSRLAHEFGRLFGDEPVGESWEIHGDLQVEGQDLTLDQLAVRYGDELLGRSVGFSGGFPILTKWLDCRAWLSVQVHPDDALAQEFTSDVTARGKTEAWYVHRAGPTAELIHGLHRDTTVEQLRQAVGDQIVPLLNRYRPEQGQLLYTAAGVVHALGPGNLIYEVQQSCDLTYRFYDWGRDRETHFEKALQCVERAVPEVSESTQSKLSCPYFDFELIRRPRTWSLSGESFQILATTSEPVKLSWAKGSRVVGAGRSVLLPASLGEVSVEGGFEEPLICVGVPDRVG
jgi:mannose-6-phosphate isomerase